MRLDARDLSTPWGIDDSHSLEPWAAGCGAVADRGARPV